MELADMHKTVGSADNSSQVRTCFSGEFIFIPTCNSYVGLPQLQCRDWMIWIIYNTRLYVENDCLCENSSLRKYYKNKVNDV